MLLQLGRDKKIGRILQTTSIGGGSMYLVDLARYWCSVGDRFGEIQESMLKLNVVR